MSQATKPKSKKGNSGDIKVTRAQILAAQRAQMENNKKGKKDKKVVEQNTELEENVNSLSKYSYVYFDPPE